MPQYGTKKVTLGPCSNSPHFDTTQCASTNSSTVCTVNSRNANWHRNIWGSLAEAEVKCPDQAEKGKKFGQEAAFHETHPERPAKCMCLNIQDGKHSYHHVRDTFLSSREHPVSLLNDLQVR